MSWPVIQGTVSLFSLVSSFGNPGQNFRNLLMALSVPCFMNHCSLPLHWFPWSSQIYGRKQNQYHGRPRLALTCLLMRYTRALAVSCRMKTYLSIIVFVSSLTGWMSGKNWIRLISTARTWYTSLHNGLTRMRGTLKYAPPAENITLSWMDFLLKREFVFRISPNKIWFRLLIIGWTFRRAHMSWVHMKNSNWSTPLSQKPMGFFYGWLWW